MKVVTRLAWGSAKFWLGAIAIVAAALAVARDAPPAHAASTEILVSKSATSPTWASSALLVKGGGTTAGNTPCVPGDQDPTTLCLYIWAKDVNNTIGAEAFQVHFTYADDRIAVTAFTGSPTWLGSTGHSTTCPVQPMSPGNATVTCDTFLPPPPFWALGSGLLATVALSSKSTMGPTTLDLSNGTWLVQGLDPSNLTQIPATVRSTNLYVAACADLNGDGHVTVSDILYVVARYHGSDPGADLDSSGMVLVNDILIAVGEFSMLCTR